MREGRGQGGCRWAFFFVALRIERGNAGLGCRIPAQNAGHGRGGDGLSACGFGEADLRERSGLEPRFSLVTNRPLPSGRPLKNWPL